MPNINQKLVVYVIMKHRTLKTRSIIREKEEYFILTKGALVQEDVRILNLEISY